MANLPVSMSTFEYQDVTHQLVQQFLGELGEMLEDLRSGALTLPQKNVLRKIVSFFDIEMKKHHLEEERHVFPVLLAKGDEALSQKVAVLQAEHQQLREGWAELRAAIEHMASTPAGDASVLLGSFARYSECFARHLALEESIQFAHEGTQAFGAWAS